MDQWCLGFAELRERVQKYSPERVEKITWVPKEKIREAARIYATTKPASIMVCVAVEQNNVMRTDWAVTSSPFCQGNKASVPRPTAFFWKAILTGEPYPIRALYCHGNNLLVAYANTQMVRQALLGPDFFAVAEVFMTETNKLADIVLPAATLMERDCVSAIYQIDYSHFHLQEKVMEVGECWTDGQILGQMAKRLGFGPLIFETDKEDLQFYPEKLEHFFPGIQEEGHTLGSLNTAEI